MATKKPGDLKARLGLNKKPLQGSSPESGSSGPSTNNPLSGGFPNIGSTANSGGFPPVSGPTSGGFPNVGASPKPNPTSGGFPNVNSPTSGGFPPVGSANPSPLSGGFPPVSGGFPSATPAPAPTPAQQAPPQAAKPPFAAGGPPMHARKPPERKEEPAKEKDWAPPPSDPTAATDVPIAEPPSTGKRLAYIGGLAVVALIFAVIGFVFGDGQQQRNLQAARAQDAGRIYKSIQPRVQAAEELFEKIKAHDGQKPDPELLTTMSDKEFNVDPAIIASNKLLLGKNITPALVRLTADTSHLKAMIKDHVAITNGADKKEIEELLSGNELLKAKGFGVVFDSDTYLANMKKFEEDKKSVQPLPGFLVIPTGEKAFEKNGEMYTKVNRARGGKALDAPFRSLLLISREDMLRSAGRNALIRYRERHARILSKAQEINGYAPTLLSDLKSLSERGESPIINN